MSKTTVITGASSGIGAATALLLASRGHRLVLAARRADELTRVARACGDALALPVDVTSRASVEQICRSAIERFGAIDVWINNVGRGIARSVAELTDADIDEMVLINVKTALYGMQAVLPHFKERGAGHIINISSNLGRIPYVPFRSAYNGAKHMLNALTANLRMDLRKTHPGICVSTVLPGPVRTDFNASALHSPPGMGPLNLPMTQTAEEVAAVIAEVIESGRTDIYTNPVYRQNVADYYRDVEAAEEKMG